MNRRELIRGIGRAMCAGATVPFIPSLLPAGVAIDVAGRPLMITDLENALLEAKRQVGRCMIAEPGQVMVWSAEDQAWYPKTVGLY